MGKTLANFVLAGTLASGLVGCGETGLKGQLTDVDRDGRKDILFSVAFTDRGSSDDHYMFFKKNLGNDRFDKPKFLYVNEYCGDVGMSSTPSEFVSSESKKGKYFLNLAAESDNHK